MQGWTVTGTGRRSFKDIRITRDIEYIRADLSDLDSLELLSGRFRELTPDLIVYNAVTYGDCSERVPTLSELETLFRVNALIPYFLLLEYLSVAPQDRLCSCVVIKSDSIYHAHRQSGVYAASKAALWVLTVVLADACRSRNASISTLPGAVSGPEEGW